MTEETLSFSAAAGTIGLVTWPLFSSRRSMLLVQLGIPTGYSLCTCRSGDRRSPQHARRRARRLLDSVRHQPAAEVDRLCHDARDPHRMHRHMDRGSIGPCPIVDRQPRMYLAWQSNRLPCPLS